jgi:hypothetical protein
MSGARFGTLCVLIVGRAIDPIEEIAVRRIEVVDCCE